ncbi:SRPBCC domain-containing protein [Pelagibacterium xiamenense]|uniref:SRPBCC domain-containing protein n=1 Tax=Pelagibacterium xiamenense TaxID=2901140 RepID=UPI001E4A5EE9|nr:SRPBCC domain-containing protein [Pelagibacterium xiamenense]MCD7059529.1 SRPBCC domain-containing protein [Pelagibacterium xiamenense]
MTSNAIAHATITLDRTYPVAPARLFHALSDTEARMRWGAPNDEALEFENADFRVGGLEISRCGPRGNLMFRVETRYLAIAQDRHIVFSEMVSGTEGQLSASLISFELTAQGAATRLDVTAQVASFAGEDMVRGNRNGLTAALRNLEREFTGADAEGATAQ